MLYYNRIMMEKLHEGISYIEDDGLLEIDNDIWKSQQ